MNLSELPIHFLICCSFSFITDAVYIVVGMGAYRLDACKCRSANFGIDVPAGELKSPGYPASYCNNLNCKYEIDALSGRSVHLSIVSFETEQRHDYLEIHQTFIFANTQHTARINTLSGKDIGWPTFASSIGSGFVLKFVTDNTETFGGFHARFNRINSTSPTNTCPAFFYEVIGEEKVLPSPPANFIYFAGCAYMLNTTEGYGIKLNVKSLASTAKLTVYETENYQIQADRTISALAEIVGLADAVPNEIISRTNSILVQVTMTQRELFPSAARTKFLFEAHYSRTDSPCKCFPKYHTIRIDQPTPLSSPGYPLEYCDKLDCETQLELDQYAIDSTHHNAIQIEIHAFNMEHGSDFVHFLDRAKHSSRHLISRTGDLITSRNKFFTFNGESGELRMITDSTVTGNGFNMTVTAVQKSDDCRCKGEAQPLEFSSATGTFSFSVPVDCGFLDCFFRFNRPATASASDRIRLVINITYIFKNGDEEFLEVLTNINNYNIIPSNINERDITVFDPALAQSGTEEITNDTPMMIWYHLASDINKQTAQFNFTYTWKPMCECGKLELEAEEGTWKQLTSPDYPNHYCNVMKCQYLVTAPPGHKVVVNITELALEPNEDVLAIFDGTNVTDKRIRLASGIEIFTDLLRSSADVMTIYFESDISITNKGFVLYYRAENPAAGDGDLSGKLGSSKHLGIITGIVLFFIAGITVAITYYKQLACFANRSGRWREERHPTTGFFDEILHPYLGSEYHSSDSIRVVR